MDARRYSSSAPDAPSARSGPVVLAVARAPLLAGDRSARSLRHSGSEHRGDLQSANHRRITCTEYLHLTLPPSSPMQVVWRCLEGSHPALSCRAVVVLSGGSCQTSLSCQAKYTAHAPPETPNPRKSCCGICGSM